MGGNLQPHFPSLHPLDFAFDFLLWVGFHRYTSPGIRMSFLFAPINLCLQQFADECSGADTPSTPQNLSLILRVGRLRRHASEFAGATPYCRRRMAQAVSLSRVELRRKSFKGGKLKDSSQWHFDGCPLTNTRDDQHPQERMSAQVEEVRLRSDLFRIDEQNFRPDRRQYPLTRRCQRDYFSG